MPINPDKSISKVFRKNFYKKFREQLSYIYCCWWQRPCETIFQENEGQVCMANDKKETKLCHICGQSHNIQMLLEFWKEYYVFLLVFLKKKLVKWLYYNYHSPSQNKEPAMPTESRNFINRTKCVSLYHGASSDLYELFLLWNKQSRVWYHNTCFLIHHFRYQCKELGLLIFSNLDQKAFCELQKQGSGISQQFATWEKYYIVHQSWLAATILFPKDFFKKFKQSFVHLF